jgi:BirA family transcriptional regulator, biotin operon repressor / biotin---[acetyl-CoA-carboxylase] ligase
MDTLFTGRTIIDLHEIASTNSYAMEALKAGDLTEGTLIRALSQTAGRGQYGNSWEAEPGKNLTFSLVMHPVFIHAAKQFYLSKIAALAVLGMLTEIVPASQYDIQIKWPNDVLADGHKIAGILIENVLGPGGQLVHSVIGVGINVNQMRFGPAKRQPVSMRLLLGREVEMSLPLERFCKHFEALYLSLKQGRLVLIDKQYQHNLYAYGRPGRYRVGTQEVEGSIRGVSEAGRLLLETAGGEWREFGVREIEFLE